MHISEEANVPFRIDSGFVDVRLVDVRLVDVRLVDVRLIDGCLGLKVTLPWSGSDTVIAASC